MHSSQRLLAGWLCLGLVACSPFGEAPDTAATVNAVATGVEATRMTGGVISTPRPTATPQPTLGSVGATVTPGSSATAFVPPTPTVTLPPPSATWTAGAPTLTAPPPTPTASGLARSGGPLISAARRDAPTLDGDLSDWPALVDVIDKGAFGGDQWTGSGDATAVYATGWDANNLYLAVRVSDDVFVQTQRGETLFRGDSLELLLDADLAGDFNSTALSGDDFQLGLSPGNFEGVNADSWLWFPAGSAGTPGGVGLGARRTASGYDLEAGIAWSLFGVTPTAGTRVGFLLSLNDNDSPSTAQQQAMVSSTAGRRLTNPGTWGTLELLPPASAVEGR